MSRPSLSSSCFNVINEGEKKKKEKKRERDTGIEKSFFSFVGLNENEETKEKKEIF